MPKLTKALVAALMSATLTFFAAAQETTPKIKAVPIQPTSPASGQQMYTTYCAVCHGADGTGNGPAASALKAPPVDLTTLSQKNGGVFPTDHMYSVLQFGMNNPAHGSSEMPIWGDLLLTLHKTSPDSEMMVHQRIVNLTRYLKEMQK